MSPIALGAGRWSFIAPQTPTERWGDALVWANLADHYDGWWVAGARDKAERLMTEALEAACC